jgi:hypothetical protein
MDWLNQVDESKKEDIILNVFHKNQVDANDKKMTVVMHSYLKDNSMV